MKILTIVQKGIETPAAKANVEIDLLAATMKAYIERALAESLGGVNLVTRLRLNCTVEAIIGDQD